MAVVTEQTTSDYGPAALPGQTWGRVAGIAFAVLSAIAMSSAPCGKRADQ